ncbi:MAG: biopolymer transporter ExbD [Kiritimatiellae bacterium]|nr:biopolymer transporter ExbD [Kiritimatiellia bacterium]
MLFNPKLKTLTATGLRMRFYPKSRIGQGLIGIAPWVDIVLLFMIFMLIDGKFVLQEGSVVELSQGVFVGGVRPDFMIVVSSVQAGREGQRDEMIFFNDVSFMVGHKARMDDLKNAFDGVVKKHVDVDLVVYADKHVKHGTVMNIMQMARLAGIKRVNMAVSEPDTDLTVQRHDSDGR